MSTNRPFAELNLWQHIFADHWEDFTVIFRQKNKREIPQYWQENVERMLGCGDIREGYYEYICGDCGNITRVGFTCKSRLCLRCFKVAVDEWLKTAQKVLFEGVIHRQVVLTLPTDVRTLVLADEKFLKVFVDAGANAVKELVEQWRRKKKIRVGIMEVLQLSGRAGNQNPHLHLVVSEGGIDKNNQWQKVSYFSTLKLRRKWQYHILTALKKAVKGTAGADWYAYLGSLFIKYPTGFDCQAMPEKGAIERLVVYLCKYVSSPPISIRRIEKYDGTLVTYRYEDHRRGLVHETLPATDFIGRMIHCLPPKGFRMVRYYGIYARPIRQKMHDMVSATIRHLCQTAQRVSAYFSRKKGKSVESSRKASQDSFGGRQVRCSHCGSTRLQLICIWSRSGGLIYDAVRDDPRAPPRVPLVSSPGVGDQKQAPSPRTPVQLEFEFVRHL